MIIMDTNVFSELMRPVPDEKVEAWAKQVAAELFLTAVTVAEIFEYLGITVVDPWNL
jgi:hypothetical protein